MNLGFFSVFKFFFCRWIDPFPPPRFTFPFQFFDADWLWPSVCGGPSSSPPSVESSSTSPAQFLPFFLRRFPSLCPVRRLSSFLSSSLFFFPVAQTFHFSSPKCTLHFFFLEVNFLRFIPSWTGPCSFHRFLLTPQNNPLELPPGDFYFQSSLLTLLHFWGTRSFFLACPFF